MIRNPYLLGLNPRVKTYLRDILILGRVQSFPLTVACLLLGYASITGTFLVADVLPLLLVGMIGHAAVFAHNDIVDRRYDMKHMKEDKPLVDGSLPYVETKYTVGVIIAVLLIASLFILGVGAGLMFALAVFTGMGYNYFSKTTFWAPSILSLWGMFIVFTGSIYAGGINVISTSLAVFLALHMFWVIIQGDLKDIESDEDSIVKFLGAEMRTVVYVDEDYVFEKEHAVIRWPTVLVQQAAMMIILTESLLLFSLATHQVIVAGLLVAATYFAVPIVSSRRAGMNDYRRDMVIHNSLMLVAVGVSMVGIISSQQVFILVFSSIVWALSWLKILFGSPFYFP